MHHHRFLCIVMRWPLHLALLPGAMPSLAQNAAERRNWFNDPFFQITSQAVRCPVPAGSYLTAAEQRAERGTSCWLAGKCARSSAYAYDQDIARALQARPSRAAVSG